MFIFTFQFLNDKIYSYNKKKTFGSWQFGKLVFWSISSFRDCSFANCSAYGTSHFLSISLVRENLRELRENLKHKIRTIVSCIGQIRVTLLQHLLPNILNFFLLGLKLFALSDPAWHPQWPKHCPFTRSTWTSVP